MQCNSVDQRGRIMSHSARSLLVVLLLAVHASAAPPALTEKQLAKKVDELLAVKWKTAKAVPAPLTDDAAFIRRVYLDLAGRIPNILEVRDFLDDDRPDKRLIWTNELLKGLRKDNGADSYSDHFAGVWGEWMVPPAGEERGPIQSLNFQSWMRGQLRENVPYDELVRRIIMIDTSKGQEVSSFGEANENKPENLAAATARLFLGIKLECAQCHDDRSGGHWAREQFWETAAFFVNERSISIPNTKITVEARFLDGRKPDWTTQKNPRLTLANWVTSADNPYFARAAANRVWAYLFGVGIIDPFDEASEQNPPSHPEVLDELGKQYVLHRFDLKYLLRTLVLTDAYQRSSLTTHPSQDDPRLFARMTVRGLSAAQLFDSLAEATEYRPDRGTPFPFGDPSRRGSPREEFISRFTGQERSTETPTTILQALHLMNGPFMMRAASLEHNRSLGTIADAVKISTPRRLETLFLVVLSRKPTEAELKRLVAYVDRGGPTGSPKKALADIFWALLNCAEFRLNH
jgi:hypothetical protein